MEFMILQSLLSGHRVLQRRASSVQGSPTPEAQGCGLVALLEAPLQGSEVGRGRGSWILRARVAGLVVFFSVQRTEHSLAHRRSRDRIHTE